MFTVYPVIFPGICSNKILVKNQRRKQKEKKMRLKSMKNCWNIGNISQLLIGCHANECFKHFLIQIFKSISLKMPHIQNSLLLADLYTNIKKKRRQQQQQIHHTNHLGISPRNILQRIRLKVQLKLQG